MKQGTDMKINRLPVRTWNWLRMNESSLSAIDIEALLSARETRRMDRRLPCRRTGYPVSAA